MSSEDNPAPVSDENANRDGGGKAKVGITFIVLVAIGITAAFFVNRAPLDEPELSYEGIPGADLSHVAAPVAEIIREARQNVARFPEDGGAWGHFGMVLFAHNFGAPAVEALAMAEHLDSTERRWPYLQGMIISQSDRAAGAIHVARAHDVDPSDPDIRLRLAEFDEELDREQQAATHFQAVLDADPKNVRATMGLARLALAGGDHETSAEYAAAAAAALPGLREAHRILAQSQQRLGNTKEARAALTTLQSLPDQEQPWSDAILNEVAELKLGPAFLSDRAHQMIAEGKTNEGLTLLRQLTEIDPDNPRRFSLLAEQFIKASRFTEADQIITSGLLKHPDCTDLMYQRGVVQKNQLQFAAAVSTLREVVADKPDFAEAHFVLGTSLAELGDAEPAADAFRNVLRFEPLYTPAHVELAAALIKTGAKTAAVSHLREALKLDPDNKRAKQLLNEVQQ